MGYSPWGFKELDTTKRLTHTPHTPPPQHTPHLPHTPHIHTPGLLEVTRRVKQSEGQGKACGLSFRQLVVQGHCILEMDVNLISLEFTVSESLQCAT